MVYREQNTKLVKSRQLIHRMIPHPETITLYHGLLSLLLLDCPNRTAYLEGVSLLLLLVLLGVVDLVLFEVAVVLPDGIADLVLAEAPVPGANRTLPGVRGVAPC
jgi:hypothetical protein